MNYEIEKKFVDDFILKNKRERLFYELKNSKKRKHAIGRFCHTSLQYLDKTKIIVKSQMITLQVIQEFIPGSDKIKWYLISWDKELDGKMYETGKAINIVMNSGMASIMVCGNYAIIREEQVNGAPDIYILSNGYR